MSYPCKCTECGTSFRSRQYGGSFCGVKCRSAFNNRRAARGAMLYDLMMLDRHAGEGSRFEELGARVPVALAAFDAEDLAAGRKRTWKRAEDVHIDTIRFRP